MTTINMCVFNTAIRCFGTERSRGTKHTQSPSKTAPCFLIPVEDRLGYNKDLLAMIISYHLHTLEEINLT